MNTRMAKDSITPMPTIVHTMLVRVGSTVCWGKVGSADDAAATSGSGGTEASGGGCSGTLASGLSPLMRSPREHLDDRYPTLVAHCRRVELASSRWPVWPRRQEGQRPTGSPGPQLRPGGRTSASRAQPQRLAHRYLVILTPTIQPGSTSRQSVKQAVSHEPD